jgi:hypothetical protein
MRGVRALPRPVYEVLASLGDRRARKVGRTSPAASPSDPAGPAA